GLLAAGVVVSTVRGALLASQEEKLWLFSTGSAWLGGLDGFLFALVGFATGFAVIFFLWVMGTCGGGDVKLFAALGAWRGPAYALCVLFGSLAVLFVEVIVKLLAVGSSPKAQRKLAAKNRPQPGSPPPREKWRITYSLPVAVATVLVLLWVFRVELRLAE